MLNHGLVAATAAATVVLLWLVVGHTVARAGLNDSYDTAVRSLNVLNNARIASLKARGNENLTLVARGAETRTVGAKQDAYDYAFEQQMKAPRRRLAEARRTSPTTSAGEKPVEAATANMKVWRTATRRPASEDDDGQLPAGAGQVIGAKDADRRVLRRVDDGPGDGARARAAEFKQAAADGRGAMTGLPEGAAVLAVLGAAGAVLGIGRRLSEYR